MDNNINKQMNQYFLEHICDKKWIVDGKSFVVPSYADRSDRDYSFMQSDEYRLSRVDNPDEPLPETFVKQPKRLTVLFDGKQRGFNMGQIQWAVITGSMPSHPVFPINGDKRNFKIENTACMSRSLYMRYRHHLKREKLAENMYNLQVFLHLETSIPEDEWKKFLLINHMGGV